MGQTNSTNQNIIDVNKDEICEIRKSHHKDFIYYDGNKMLYVAYYNMRNNGVGLMITFGYYKTLKEAEDGIEQKIIKIFGQPENKELFNIE
jgi:hypothetical protein